MEFYVEAKLAYGDVVTYLALVLGLVNEISFAACALEPSVVLMLSTVAVSSYFYSSAGWANFFGFISLLLFLFSVDFCVLPQKIDGLRTPICAAEWAGHVLA